MSILEPKNLRKTYGQGKAQVYAPGDIDLTVENGGFAVVAGTPGSGKTTFLNTTGCLDIPALRKATGAKFRQTVVLITHNEEIVRLADRILRIEGGKLIKRQVTEA